MMEYINVKQNILILIAANLLLASTLSSCGSSNVTSNAVKASATATDVLFVCGGNTGRSPMAEALADGNGINAFSRASGLDMSDSLEMEKGALSALARFAESESKRQDYYTKYVLEHKAQQITYDDIMKSSSVYPMTETHMCRVALTIELNANSELEAQQEFKKVHLLSSCATGKYTAVPDGFGAAESQEIMVYNGIVQQLNNYILTIKRSHNSCVVATESSPLNSSLDEAVDYCCSQYSTDLNKRYNHYCATPH